MCSYHDNDHRLFLALKEHKSFAVDFRAFIDQVTCDSSRKECMSSDCDDCTPLSPAVTVSYQQWQNIDKVEKVNIIGMVIDAIIELKKNSSGTF